MKPESHSSALRISVSIVLAFMSFTFLAKAPQAAAYAQVDESAREYRIKSAFLFHFLHYGEWPRDAYADGDDLIVCVAGDVHHVAAQATLSDKRLEGRRVAVRLLDETEQSRDCRIAYFGESYGPVREEVLHRLRDEGVLTVGETASFTNQGGMIRLYKNRNRIRFEVNLEAVRSAGIQISSRMLQLATIV